MNLELFWEIFGYIGTACVIISMLMTSVVKLRLINMVGALISLIYALIVGAAPIAVLNAALIIIQIFQLYRLWWSHTDDRSDRPAKSRIAARKETSYETEH